MCMSVCFCVYSSLYPLHLCSECSSRETLSPLSSSSSMNGHSHILCYMHTHKVHMCISKCNNTHSDRHNKYTTAQRAKWSPSVYTRLSDAH